MKSFKIKPGTDPLLSKAIVDSVKGWRYKPWTGIDRLNESVISRLTFHFIIRKGQPYVKMYDPGSHPRLMDCLGCTNSNKEILEWKKWEEVWSNGEPGVEPSSP